MNNGDYPMSDANCIRRWDLATKKMIVKNEPTPTGNKKVCADDWSSVSVGYCRKCKKPIAPYDTEYYERFADCMVLYSYKNGYCESCAQWYGSRKHPNRPEKHPVKITQDVYGRETVLYDDGSETVELPWENDDLQGEKK